MIITSIILCCNIKHKMDVVNKLSSNLLEEIKKIIMHGTDIHFLFLTKMLETHIACSIGIDCSIEEMKSSLGENYLILSDTFGPDEKFLVFMTEDNLFNIDLYEVKYLAILRDMDDLYEVFERSTRNKLSQYIFDMIEKK